MAGTDGIEPDGSLQTARLRSVHDLALRAGWTAFVSKDEKNRTRHRWRGLNHGLGLRPRSCRHRASARSRRATPWSVIMIETCSSSTPLRRSVKTIRAIPSPASSHTASRAKACPMDVNSIGRTTRHLPVNQSPTLVQPERASSKRCCIFVIIRPPSEPTEYALNTPHQPSRSVCKSTQSCTFAPRRHRSTGATQRTSSLGVPPSTYGGASRPAGSFGRPA